MTKTELVAILSAILLNKRDFDQPIDSIDIEDTVKLANKIYLESYFQINANPRLGAYDNI